MVFNDLCDREHDRVRFPLRPIPSGRVLVRDARIFTVLLFTCGFLLLGFAPNRGAWSVAALLCAMIVSYDLHHKGNPLSVLLMASCRFLVFAVAALALSGRFSGLAVLAGAAQFCYIMILSLVARCENNRPRPYRFPVMPALLAGISLLDGFMLALLSEPVWLVAGICGFLLTAAGQRYVRGD
jgi:hypothetical protein